MTVAVTLQMVDQGFFLLPPRCRPALPAGAHMNAALTFTNCALGRMSWKKFPVYVLGQFMGSFLAAATIYCLFYREYPGLSLLL